MRLSVLALLPLSVSAYADRLNLKFQNSNALARFLSKNSTIEVIPGSVWNLSMKDPSSAIWITVDCKDKCEAIKTNDDIIHIESDAVLKQITEEGYACPSCACLPENHSTPDTTIKKPIEPQKPSEPIAKRSSPYEAKLWGLTSARVFEANTLSLGKGSTVVISDTGAQKTHPEFKDRVLYDDDTYVPETHGTHTAGTAVGLNVGAAPQAQLIFAPFMKNGEGPTSTALAGWRKALSIQSDRVIISNSWGGGSRSQMMIDFINANPNVLFTFAASNEGRDNDKINMWPANYNLPNTITVASYSQGRILSSFSNYGAKMVHVAAPGSNIFSSAPETKYLTLSGTSMATPLVSGILALVWSKHPNKSALEVKECLLSHTQNFSALKGKTQTNAVDAYKAVLCE